MAEKQSKPRKLTPKQERFVDEYLIDLNASAAYRRAYVGAKESSSRVQASRMLADPNIASRIAKRMKEREERTHITQDRVLKELARLAFSDIRKAFHEDGRLKLPQELDDDTAAALAGIDTVTSSVHGGDEEAPMSLTTKKVKIADKNASLTLAMRHLGMLNDKLQIDAPMVRIKDYTGR